MVLASNQGKREFCIALFNRGLNKNGICPANHSVDYRNGWFYMDDHDPIHDPKITAEADELMSIGSHIVLYCDAGNTYVIADNPEYFNPQQL